MRQDADVHHGRQLERAEGPSLRDGVTHDTSSSVFWPSFESSNQ